MNSWQRVQTRRRLHLVAILGSTVGLIAAIYYWSPETLDRISQAVLGQTFQQPYEAPAQEEKQNQPVVKKTAKRVRRPLNLAVSEVPDPAPVRILQKPASHVQSDSGHANVKSDAADVYSFNSSNSSVVETLKKGDRVETNLEVQDLHGRWTLVRTNELKKSGFVRSENLERSSANPNKDPGSDPIGDSSASH